MFVLLITSLHAFLLCIFRFFRFVFLFFRVPYDQSPFSDRVFFCLFLALGSAHWRHLTEATLDWSPAFASLSTLSIQLCNRQNSNPQTLFNAWLCCVYRPLTSALYFRYISATTFHFYFYNNHTSTEHTSFLGLRLRTLAPSYRSHTRLVARIRFTFHAFYSAL